MTRKDNDREGASGAEEAAAGSSEKGAVEGEGTPPLDFLTRLKRTLRGFRFPISVVVLVLGLVLFFIGLFAWTPLGSSNGALSGLEQPLLGTDSASGCCGPDWTLLMLPGGGLLAAIGGYLAGVYIIARRRFEHLMKTKSKAEFLRNVTEAEDLLWDLTPEDEIRLVRKKLELKIRG